MSTPGTTPVRRRAVLSGRAVSLGELMDRYRVGELVDLQSFMCGLAHFVREMSHRGHPPGSVIFCMTADQHAMFNDRVAKFHELLEEIDLPVSAIRSKKVVEILRSATLDAEGEYSVQGQALMDLGGDIGSIANIVGDELKTKLFVMLPSNKSAYYQPEQPVFAKEVVDRLPNCTSDMFEAGNCFALGRHTACVFHLMRLMEVGVQEFGTKLGVALATELNWQNILERLNPIIKKAKDAKDPNAVAYASIQAHLYNVKIAWRNEVMHPKATYDEEEARGVLSAVQAFLADLVKVI